MRPILTLIAILLALPTVVQAQTAAAGADALYEKKCASCHGDAPAFAKLNLEIRDGRLVSRMHDTDIVALMKEHGRLKPADQAAVIDLLRRQLEAGLPR